MEAIEKHSARSVAYEPLPHVNCAGGALRLVGVEVEFIGPSAKTTAELVREVFGGRVIEVDPYSFRIEGGWLGTMNAKLDTRFAHSQNTHDADGILERFLSEIESETRAIFVDLAEWVVPLEITTPPLAVASLGALDELLDRLRLAGAEGTEESPVYAFGTHFNPEIPTFDEEYLLAVLRSYLLLEDSLRAHMKPDLTRRLLPFAAPFPVSYVRKLADPQYRPSLRQMIEDYATFNPTRNRSLDMLTPFAWFDATLVDNLVPNSHVSARPTFHYRLPDLRINDPCWSLCREWNRWVMVERVAEDRPLLDRLSRAYLAHDHLIDGAWADRADELVAR